MQTLKEEEQAWLYPNPQSPLHSDSSADAGRREMALLNLEEGWDRTATPEEVPREE